MEEGEELGFHRLFQLGVIRRQLWLQAANGVQLFAVDAFGQGFGVLVFAQMGQEVGDVKDRIVGGVADVDLYFATVLPVGDAVEGQGQAGPLVFLMPP